MDKNTIIHYEDKWYREVDREAKVGELIKIVRNVFSYQDHIGEIYTVESKCDDIAWTNGKWNDGSTLNAFPRHYVVLEPLEKQLYGQEYLEVNRVAEVGELVRVTKDLISANTFHIGNVYKVKKKVDTMVWVDGQWLDGSDMNLCEGEYTVLEPVNYYRYDECNINARVEHFQADNNQLSERVGILEKKLGDISKLLGSYQNRA